MSTVAPTGADIARDPEAALGLLAGAAEAAARAKGASSIILAGAGLAGLAPRIAPRVPVPVICSLAAAVRMAEALAALRPAKPTTGSFAVPPAVETIGLGESLARLFASR